MENSMMVSIICNAYNHEKYIRDTLEGFVSQKTDFPFEVLVHDDASPDGTAAIIREYEEKYPELIKPIYQTKNQYSQGCAITRTFQIPRVKGKYIAFCEGDDYWTDPMKLQKQVDFMEANPEYTLCACSTVWFNQKTGIHEKRGQIEKDRDISLEEIILERGGRIFQLASVLLRAQLYENQPSWMRQFPIGDYPLAINAALNGKVHMLSDVMTVYRYYADNSWTVRMDTDERRIGVSKRMIQGLEALDEQTQYVHHEVVSRRIKRHKYTLALMSHDYETLKSEELREIYRSRSVMKRTSDFLHCKYPKVYARVFKPLARMIKSKHGE